MQNGRAFAFQELHNFFQFIGFDFYFRQRIAKMFQENIEVRPVQSLYARLRMGSANIFTRVHDLASQEHGDKHALPGVQVFHVRSLEKMAELFISQDSPVERFSGRPDGAPPPDHFVEVIDHLDPPEGWEPSQHRIKGKEF
jgi:hypothetical protein